MNKLLTAEELALLLGIGAPQVRKLTRENSIPHHRVGGAIRYDYEAVKRATSVDDPHALIGRFYDRVVRAWDSEGPRGNDYKMAHFDGVTAAVRDIGGITSSECEAYRKSLRSTAGYKVWAV